MTRAHIWLGPSYLPFSGVLKALIIPDPAPRGLIRRDCVYDNR